MAVAANVTSTAFTTTGTAAVQPRPADDSVMLYIDGTFTGFQGTIRGSYDGTNYVNILCYRMDSGAMITGGTTINWSATAFDLLIPAPFPYIQLNVTQVSTGTVNTNLVASNFLSKGSGGAVGGSITNISTISNVITSTSANALAVGPSGVTNPAFNVDASTGSAATGINIAAAAAGSGVAITVLSSGTNEAVTLDAKGSGSFTIGSVSTGNVILGTSGHTLTLNNSTGAVTLAAGGLTLTSGAIVVTSGNVTMTAGNLLLSAGTATVTSNSASALTVGRLGATTPALKVDASAATSITGVKITSNSTGNGVAIAAIGEASNGKLTLDSQGSGVLAFGDTSTGQIYLGRGSLLAPQIGLGLTALGTSQSSTPTSAQLLGGILTQTGATGAGTVTLPTGTNLSAACSRTPITGDSFDCDFYNLGGSQTLTITGATGTTVIGTAAVGTGKNAKIKFVCTAANTWTVAVMVSA